MDDEILKGLASLPPHQRLVRYLQLAEDALQLAIRTEDLLARHEFMGLAAKYRALAKRTQKEMDDAPLPCPPPEKKDEKGRPER